MMSSAEDQKANKTSMDLISKHLLQVLDQVAIITDELQEMRDREGGDICPVSKPAPNNDYKGFV